jgi:hypothetical protein
MKTVVMVGGGGQGCRSGPIVLPSDIMQGDVEDLDIDGRIILK